MSSVDKEAQEKIAGAIRNSMVLGFEVTDPEIVAKALLDQMRKLGYRKPPDRPELKKEIERILTKHFLNETTLGEARDQIIDLIPDKPPEGKPPLLSDEGIIDILSGFDTLKRRKTHILHKDRAIAQAQRQSDIKWYRGEK